MSTVTISGTEFTVYQDPDEIDLYALGAIGDAADAWRATDADTKARAAVSVTRLLDRQAWTGAKTDAYQPLAFPRTGLTYADGSQVDPDTIPTEVLEADCELAMSLVAGSTVENDPSVAQTRTLKAGSVMIEYFRPLDQPALFSQAIMQLIGLWLGGAVILTGVASGTKECTSFDREYLFTRGF